MTLHSTGVEEGEGLRTKSGATRNEEAGQKDKRKTIEVQEW